MRPQAQLDNGSIWEAFDRMTAAGVELARREIELARVELGRAAARTERTVLLLLVGGILLALGWFALSWALLTLAGLSAPARLAVVALINLTLGGALVACSARGRADRGGR